MEAAAEPARWPPGLVQAPAAGGARSAEGRSRAASLRSFGRTLPATIPVRAGTGRGARPLRRSGRSRRRRRSPDFLQGTTFRPSAIPPGPIPRRNPLARTIDLPAPGRADAGSTRGSGRCRIRRRRAARLRCPTSRRGTRGPAARARTRWRADRGSPPGRLRGCGRSRPGPPRAPGRRWKASAPAQWEIRRTSAWRDRFRPIPVATARAAGSGGCRRIRRAAREGRARTVEAARGRRVPTPSPGPGQRRRGVR